MASSSEVGHNKNVANFSTAYQILEEMGTLYNPSNSNILLPKLAPKKTDLAATMKMLDTQNPIYKNAVADREVEIAPMSKIATRSLNFSNSTAISEKDKENLLSQVKKIRGDKKLKDIKPETSESDAISTSQMSYDSRIANFSKYVSQQASHPEYIPNENDLKITTLQSYHERLSTLSGLVNKSGIALITGRKNRNTLLYDGDSNVIRLIKEIKFYLKSLGAAGLPYYKAMVRLKFKDIER